MAPSLMKSVVTSASSDTSVAQSNIKASKGNTNGNSGVIKSKDVKEELKLDAMQVREDDIDLEMDMEMNTSARGDNNEEPTSTKLMMLHV